MDYLGKDIPKLGFGLMRLPMQGKEVDIQQTCEMADKFLEAGFTYFDTAYGYLGGKSEESVKEVLVKRHPRESFQLATKLPAWAKASTAQEARDMLETSLRRTGAEYFDFYLLHNLGGNRTKIFEDYCLWDYVQEQKAKGVLKHIGFSFHDKADALDEILTAHPEAEFVQLQINYADWDDPEIQSAKCLEVARKHKKPVIIMEPVKGGSLATLPQTVAQPFVQADPKASVASWALRFAASQPGLITVLSGMSNMGQMEDNLATMKNFKPLDEKEMQIIEKVRTLIKETPRIPCTDCRYCVKDCPQNIYIPGIFEAMNTLLVYGNKAGAKGDYALAIRKGPTAADCIACGQCESVCPQHIPIIEHLKKAHQELG